MDWHYANMNKLQENIVALLARDGISENELARRSGVNQTTLNRIIRGDILDLRDGTLEPLAEYANTTVDVLKRGDVLRPRRSVAADVTSADDLAHQLLAMATPRSGRAWERMSEADLLLLESLAERFMIPAQPGAVSAALHRKAKGHAPSGA